VKKLFEQIEGWRIPTTRYYMNKAYWDDIAKWASKSEQEIILEQMKELYNQAEVKKYLVSRVKDGRDLATFRRVVETHFPHYLEMLDKYLILR